MLSFMQQLYNPSSSTPCVLIPADRNRDARDTINCLQEGVSCFSFPHTSPPLSNSRVRLRFDALQTSSSSGGDEAGELAPSAERTDRRYQKAA